MSSAMSSATSAPHERLQQALQRLSTLVETPALAADESRLVAAAAEVMRDLVRHDDWLPDEMAVPHPQFYQQFLLHADPLDRYSLVSFVWGPGQATPIHNHTVWGIIGMLRGAELEQRFAIAPGRVVASGAEHRLEPGDIGIVSPTVGDVHRVRNAYPDQVSISVHLYGGNIGRIRRSVFDAASGQEKPFVSGYSNRLMPNPWFKPAP